MSHIDRLAVRAAQATQDAYKSARDRAWDLHIAYVDAMRELPNCPFGKATGVVLARETNPAAFSAFNQAMIDFQAACDASPTVKAAEEAWKTAAYAASDALRAAEKAWEHVDDLSTNEENDNE